MQGCAKQMTAKSEDFPILPALRKFKQAALRIISGQSAFDLFYCVKLFFATQIAYDISIKNEK